MKPVLTKSTSKKSTIHNSAASDSEATSSEVASSQVVSSQSMNSTAMSSHGAQKYFIFLTVFISLLLSLAGAEWVLSYQRQSFEQNISSSENMDHGMILYDADLGWKLKPYWSGDHHHYDFDASYKINWRGFRGSVTADDTNNTLVIGDSFSFGLGVNDNEVFTALLNVENAAYSFNNFSVPGYSTDQQFLLLKSLLGESTQNVLLVVYLGNDLFDNMRAFPLQAEHGKPYFEVVENSLNLKNSPVPLMSKPAAAKRESIATVVLGNSKQNNNLRNILADMELSHRLGIQRDYTVLSENFMNTRFADTIKVFDLLVLKIDELVKSKNSRLSIALLPGRSYVEQPNSLSAQYQEFFRKNILATLNNISTINAIDLATYLKEVKNKGVDDMFYPNEGHLTATGHRHVADYLMKTLNNKQTTP